MNFIFRPPNHTKVWIISLYNCIRCWHSLPTCTNFSQVGHYSNPRKSKIYKLWTIPTVCWLIPRTVHSKVSLRPVTTVCRLALLINLGEPRKIDILSKNINKNKYFRLFQITWKFWQWGWDNLGGKQKEGEQVFHISGLLIVLGHGVWARHYYLIINPKNRCALWATIWNNSYTISSIILV